MDIEHVLVIFESPDGRNCWKPVERENIPDWLRQPAVMDRLVAGEQARDTTREPEMWYRATAVAPARPAGQHHLMRNLRRESERMSDGGIALVH